MFFQISGTFQVNIPPILLGYTWSNTYVSPREDCSGQNPKECTFLNIFATIEPQISYVMYNPKVDEVGLTLTRIIKKCRQFERPVENSNLSEVNIVFSLIL